MADLAKKLQVGAQMKRRGDSPFVIGKEMKMWGSRQQAFAKVLNRIDEQGGARIFDAAIAATLRSRQGLGDSMRNLECFSVTMADNLR
jgi:DNA polymerase III delta subunit